MPFDFTLSESQQLLGREAGRAIDEYVPLDLARQAMDHGLVHTRAAWQTLAGFGWAGLCITDEGAGLGLTELVLVAEALGRRAAPLPVVWHNAVGRHISGAPGGDARQALVRALAEGTAIATLAHWEAGDRPDLRLPATRAERVGDRIRLHGMKNFVPYATVAGFFLVTADLDGSYATVLLPHAEATIAPYTSTGRDGRATVSFDTILDGDALVATGDTVIVQDLLDFTRIGLCAYAVGAAQAAMEMTAAYAKDRVIFGRPLGSFQAVQHRCADMLFDTEGGRMLTLEAAWQTDTGRPAQTAVAAACAYVGPGTQRVLAHAHQIHGAIGVTFEHNLPLLSTAVKATAADLGREDANREAVAVSLGM